MLRRRRFASPGVLSFTHSARSLGTVLALAGLASCTEIDTARVQPFKATLGDDLYGVMCDRLAASSLPEDTSGESYEAICHPTADGKYGDDVDESVLPPPSGDAKKARALSLAKMRAMARWRSELVRAFNASFPDVEIDDPTTAADGDKVRLHDGLLKLGQALTPLYEMNPFDEKGEPLFPSSTRAMGRLMDGLAKSDGAKSALARIWARKGYRPFQVGMGAMRSALAYPQLRSFTKASLAVLGPDGAAAPHLQKLFAAAKREMAASQPSESKLPPYRLLDVATAQPERPRTTIEFAADLFLAQDEAYAEPGAPPRYIAMRDRRGFVVPAGNEPGTPGTVPAPFFDGNNDGFADVDAHGRFVGGNNQPLALDPPFAIPGQSSGPTDAFGRPQTPLYTYIDTSRTAIGAVARSLETLANPETEALMNALAGAHVLYGPREQARYDYTLDAKDAIVKDGEACPTVPADACLSYNRFKGEESPLVDLIYAAGPLLADADSDALLLGLSELVEKHPDDVARLLGAALKVRQIALDHDKLAAQGKEPLAAMAYETPIWDEVAEVLGKIAEEPRLVQKVVKGFSDPVLVSTQGGSPGVGATLATFIRMRDEFNYNPGNLNGPAVNLTDNASGGSTADPKHPVDQSKPKTGKNRSLFERTLGVIHDVNKVKFCNKEGAKVFMDVFGGTVLPVSYAECDLVQFDNLAGYYLDALLPDNHPKRSKLDINNSTLDELLALADDIGINVDDLFQKSSAITGLTLTPTLPALNRLVFFGAESELYDMPDIDPFINAQNEYPNLFISNMLEPAPTSACPKKPNGVNECADASGTLRVAGPNTIFGWERLGFYSYLRPVVTPFAEVGCSEDVSICPKNEKYYAGEQYFVDLIDILHRHWSKDAGNTYEPILAEAFETDLIPALVEFSKVATTLSKITVKRGPKAGQVWTGADVLAKTAEILFSPKYAAGIGLTDRKGNKGTTWTDGTPQSQVTVFSLFADGLHGLDVRFDTACEGGQGGDLEACKADAAARKAQWKSARSRLVDEFLTVDGSGPGAKFRNQATPKVLASTLRLAREQINAHCPTRETGGGCAWARTELADKLSQTLSGPLFASLMDVQEALRADEPARKATQNLLVHLLSGGGQGDELEATLASFADVLQMMRADSELSPILQALAPMMSPADDPDGQGTADAMIQVLLALTEDQYDPYHVMDHVLPAVVSPMDDGTNRAPIEIFMDAIADIHRIDAADTGPLEAPDYGTMMKNMHDFMASETRGLEQFYYIVQHRPRQ